jgi:hypothetical protein
MYGIVVVRAESSVSQSIERRNVVRQRTRREVGRIEVIIANQVRKWQTVDGAARKAIVGIILGIRWKNCEINCCPKRPTGQG